MAEAKESNEEIRQIRMFVAQQSILYRIAYNKQQNAADLWRHEMKLQIGWITKWFIKFRWKLNTQPIKPGKMKWNVSKHRIYADWRGNAISSVEFLPRNSQFTLLFCPTYFVALHRINNYDEKNTAINCSEESAGRTSLANCLLYRNVFCFMTLFARLICVNNNNRV